MLEPLKSPALNKHQRIINQAVDMFCTYLTYVLTYLRKELYSRLGLGLGPRKG